jgi:hypothetical protein
MTVMSHELKVDKFQASPDITILTPDQHSGPWFQPRNTFDPNAIHKLPCLLGLLDGLARVITKIDVQTAKVLFWTF